MMADAAAGEPADDRVISISWFLRLTDLLGKYLAVLRYELEQVKDEQTIEALVHAEITKILVREFTPGCITTEYPIGSYFKDGKNANGDDFERKLRADIAIFHPAVERTEDSPPLAVFELKRQGGRVALLDDVYRLAVVSLRTNATGYFVFAGPKSHVERAMASVPMLTQMDTPPVSTHTFQYTALSESSLYQAEDFAGATEFYGKRMHTETTSAGVDQYDLRIFAFHHQKKYVAKKLEQRIDLAVRARAIVEDEDEDV